MRPHVGDLIRDPPTALKTKQLENKCYRRILNVHRSDHRTNESVYSELSVKPGVLVGFYENKN